MKIFLSIALAVALALGAPETNEPAKVDIDVSTIATVEAGKLHVSTNAAFPPYEMEDDAGNYIGIDIELADAIAQKLGLELVVEDMDFDAALTAVQTGKSDISIAGFSATTERMYFMDFSMPYTKNVQAVIVREGSYITTVDDLAYADVRIGTKKDTTGYIYCPDDYGEERVMVYDTGAIAVQALLNDLVDCVVIDNKSAQAFAAANEGLTILNTVYSDEEFAIAVHKGNAQMLNAINRALAELQADGTVQAIVDKYINAE